MCPCGILACPGTSWISTEFYEDLERGRLPAVAYIAPAGASEHPPGRVSAGATLTRSLLTALARSSAWDSSAFMWTYDESGGWFDHVRPPRGAGFRVPALLVSPYARRGYVDSTPLDTTSIPAFIERNWRLAPSTRPPALGRAFDFSAPPREARIVSAERRSGERREARIWVIYLGYGTALAAAVALIGWIGLRRTLLATSLLMALAAPAAAQAPDTIQTVPPVPGMRFALEGVEFRADAAGRAHPPPGARGSPTVLPTPIRPGVRARFDRWYDGGPDRRDQPRVPRGLPLRVTSTASGSTRGRSARSRSSAATGAATCSGAPSRAGSRATA